MEVYSGVHFEFVCSAAGVKDINVLYATIDMGRKDGGAAVPLSRRAETPPNTMWPGPRLYFRTKWRLHPSSRLATIDMGQKLGRGLGPLFGKGSYSPSNTMAI